MDDGTRAKETRKLSTSSSPPDIKNNPEAVVVGEERAQKKWRWGQRRKSGGGRVCQPEDCGSHSSP